MKYVEDINYSKIAALEARVKVIERADLYDPVQAIEMYLVLNVILPKNSHNLSLYSTPKLSVLPLTSSSMATRW
jgi:hypothetical protein